MFGKYLVIAAFAGAVMSVGGCGESVGSTPQDDTQNKAADSTHTYHGPYSDEVGALPDTAPPAAVADMQARLAARVAEGIDRALLPAGVADALRPDALAKIERHMHLVVRHIEPYDGSGAPEACGGAPVYSGFISDESYLRLTVQSEAEFTYYGIPFGILACDADGDIQLVLLPANDDRLDSPEALTVIYGGN